jgi:hypothetical protein
MHAKTTIFAKHLLFGGFSIVNYLDFDPNINQNPKYLLLKTKKIT